MKVGFYLHNQNISSVDCRNILAANPGIGGSEYLIIVVTQLLSVRDNNIDVVLYVQKYGQFDSAIKQVQIKDLGDAILNADKEKVNYLVFKHEVSWINTGVLNKDCNVKLIPWCHNFVSTKYLSYYWKNTHIVKILNVGREQMDLYRDHRAFEKSEFIYNAVPSDISRRNQEQLKMICRKPIVTYVGSLIECKGFLFLAKVWKYVVSQVPNAELYVIGAGNLYSRNAILGPLGIADKKFEEKFIPYLSESNKLMDSVHFMGIMGEEKNDILIQTKIGVPNPGGETETFGITAVEMQLLGCWVTTIKCPGYIDTVYNQENLYNHTYELGKYIVKLLNCKNAPSNEVYQYMSDNFSFDVVASRWEHFFGCLSNNKVFDKSKYTLRNPQFSHKKIKETLRKIKNRFNLHFIPSIEYATHEFPVACISLVKSVVKQIIRRQ